MSIFDGLKRQIEREINHLGDGIKGGINDLGNSVEKQVKDVANQSEHAVKSVGNQVEGEVKKVGNEIKDEIQEVIEEVQDLFTDASKIFAYAVGHGLIQAALKEAVEKLKRYPVMPDSASFGFKFLDVGFSVSVKNINDRIPTMEAFVENQISPLKVLRSWC